MGKNIMEELYDFDRENTSKEEIEKWDRLYYLAVNGEGKYRTWFSK